MKNIIYILGFFISVAASADSLSGQYSCEISSPFGLSLKKDIEVNEGSSNAFIVTTTGIIDQNAGVTNTLENGLLAGKTLQVVLTHSPAAANPFGSIPEMISVYVTGLDFVSPTHLDHWTKFNVPGYPNLQFDFGSKQSQSPSITIQNIDGNVSLDCVKK